MTRTEIDTLLKQYTAAWSEPDPQARQALLQAAWHETGEYTDPIAHAANRAELDGVIARFQQSNPGARFTLHGQAIHHHNYICFFWVLQLANGTELQGTDYGEIGADGKLRKIVGFF